MAGRPAARILDPVVHPLPPVLQPGPGSFNVIIGYRPAWRGVPAAAAASINAAKKTSDAALKVAKAATTAASGTPAAPAAKAAEELAKTAALAAMGSMISGMSGGADIHMCATPLPLPPHGPGVVVDGSPTVLINGLPACRQGDTIVEALGPPNKIAMGQFNVLIGNSANPAAPSVGSSILDMIGDAIEDVVEAVTEAAEDAMEAVEDFLNPDVVTGLGEDVDAIVNMSPTLKEKLNRLKDAGWEIQTTATGRTQADRGAQVITINTTGKSNEQLTTSLAHEAGHADYEMDPQVPMDGNTRDEYVEGNLNRSLRDEGEATLTNVEVRDEITEAGGPEIPIAGNAANHPAYEQSYQDMQDGGDRDTARDEIGGAFADGEHVNGPDPKPTYREYYGGFYEKQYDDANP